ncbi:hypothetical protein RIE95_01115 [Acidithiobacillus thiooxidans]|uniref:hypothetical protein n=1 Tax=Acidithiobacillus thiooxidans TaxID=930 RepID=UPI00285899C5|nr:hypothetical protein [Acidithiobacillus thiooxidans]MDR7925609.1 hypothetical protein [Acidithiobacillus thiooxidans]
MAGNRWQVAVTKFRQGLKDSGLTRAVSRYLTGLFLSKDDAVTDFVENVLIQGKRQDVMVSWASNAQALKEELLVIQSCLNAAGVLDERQPLAGRKPLDFDLGLKISDPLLKAGGASVHYSNQNGQVELQGQVDPAKLLTGILSTQLHGHLGFTLRRNHLQGDPRLPLMAGIIALESASTEIELTCQNLTRVMGMLSVNQPSQEKVHYAQDYLLPAEHYLRQVWAALKTEVEQFGMLRGSPERLHNGLLVDALLTDLLGEHPDFEGAFATLAVLEGTFSGNNLHNQRAHRSGRCFPPLSISAPRSVRPRCLPLKPIMPITCLIPGISHELPAVR